ncbi:MAG: aldehyde dehydrogenase family protein [Thermoanaerobaculia bacterium]|nr:aldehyde dehydrogenase family protein [Thermoanaerobaculia bacterium]
MAEPATRLQPYSMTIDGQEQPAVATFGVVNPALGTVFADAPECTRAQLDDAMESAARAFPAWARDEAARRGCLLASAEALRGEVESLASVLTREQGKPLPRAREEVLGAAAWLEHAAGLELPVEALESAAAQRIEVRRRPFGVVAAITPWNYPVLLAMWKVAPALRAGNTVVLKPSPFTPLSTLKMGEALRGVLPPGVLNVVSGGDQLGSWMTRHGVPRKISFTGSVAAGRRVAAAAAEDLKRVTLELGGNDAAILLPDVDVRRVAEGVFWGAFQNSGQVCSAIKRLYVHEEQAEALLAALGEVARGVRLGDGLDDGVDLGPVQNRPQLERIVELVEDARDRGAILHAGGHRCDGEGYFFEPTVMSGIAEGVRIVDEEQFGPVLPVLGYAEVDEAVERANRSSFGLSGSVWSRDPERAAEVAAELECGTVWVNQHLAIVPQAPFGGHKSSGIGVENGRWGLESFTQLQTLHLAAQ